MQTNRNEALDYFLMGRVEYVNPESGSIGIVTRLGERRLVDESLVGREARLLGAEVVVVERAGRAPYVVSVSDWFHHGTLDFFKKGTDE